MVSWLKQFCSGVFTVHACEHISKEHQKYSSLLATFIRLSYSLS